MNRELLEFLEQKFEPAHFYVDGGCQIVNHSTSPKFINISLPKDSSKYITGPLYLTHEPQVIHFLRHTKVD